MSRVVYVGHVPFDLTEEQIEDIFKSAGPVQQTRLVFDRATGKSKGFAFVQYFEPESAASAVRNLDNYKVGNMHLKVNYSSGKFPGNGPNQGNQNGKKSNNNDDDTGVVPEIVNIVSSMPPPQKLELLNELRTMISTDRSKLQTLLEQNPQLAYAIVQSMFELGKIDGAAASSLIADGGPSASASVPNSRQSQSRSQSNPPRRAGSNTPQPQTASPYQQQMAPQYQQSYQQGPPFYSHQNQAPNQPSYQQQQQQQQQLQQQQQPPQMGMPGPPQGSPMPPMQLTPEQLQMYQQIISLTPEQLNSMPPEQRQAAMGIRTQMEAQMQQMAMYQ